MAKKVYNSEGKIKVNEGKVEIDIHLTDIGTDKYKLNKVYNISTKKTRCIVGLLTRKSKHRRNLEFEIANFTKRFNFNLNEVDNYNPSQKLSIAKGDRVRFIVFHDEDFQKCKLNCFQKHLDKYGYNDNDRIINYIRKSDATCFIDNCSSKEEFIAEENPQSSGDSILVGI